MTLRDPFQTSSPLSAAAYTSNRGETRKTGYNIGVLEGGMRVMVTIVAQEEKGRGKEGVFSFSLSHYSSSLTCVPPHFTTLYEKTLPGGSGQ